MVGLEGSLKVVERWDFRVVGGGRVLKGHRIMRSCNGWGGRVLKGHGILRFCSGWVGKVLKGHRVSRSCNGWGGNVLKDHGTRVVGLEGSLKVIES